ncbi:hypothetical protein CRE_13723 [Caenorhabditis remanei]|uniref:C2H2-type domain-containing protein n=1 Tax=Caenorhabditis remanei TaxID=31234 RepID=E3NBS1_CAERE|nr:hypothetical protein CRE_13723 [Caenorhabditis remanei]
MDRICCTKGQFWSKRSNNVVKHLRSMHDATEDDIDEFKKKLVSSRALKNHGSGAWECQECKKLCPSERSLNTHIAKEHVSRILDPAEITLASRPSSPIASLSPPKKVQCQKIDECDVIIEKTASAPGKPKEGAGKMKCPMEDCGEMFSTREKIAVHFR